MRKNTDDAMALPDFLDVKNPGWEPGSGEGRESATREPSVLETD
jgi:hypothetical protein